MLTLSWLAAAASCELLAVRPDLPKDSPAAARLGGTISPVQHPDLFAEVDQTALAAAGLDLRADEILAPEPAPLDALNENSESPDESALETRVLELVNVQREANGVRPLKFSPALASAARQHNLAMAQHGFFEHQGEGEPGLFDRVLASGESTDFVGENLFESSTADEIADECVKMWMWSPGHRENMLEPGFVKTGIAIGRSTTGQNYITEDFAD